jgi:hypothetical protein
LSDLGTFQEVPEASVPAHCKKIPLNWIFKLKYDRTNPRLEAIQAPPQKRKSNVLLKVCKVLTRDDLKHSDRIKLNTDGPTYREYHKQDMICWSPPTKISLEMKSAMKHVLTQTTANTNSCQENTLDEIKTSEKNHAPENTVSRLLHLTGHFPTAQEDQWTPENRSNSFQTMEQSCQPQRPHFKITTELQR